MPAHITVTTEPFGDLVAVHGEPDPSTIDGAADDLGLARRRSGAVVVDLRDALLVPPQTVVHLVAELEARCRDRPIALVCDRLSGRRLLRKSFRHLAVDVVDALPPAATRGGSPGRATYS
jgi:hypothetical protein